MTAIVFNDQTVANAFAASVDAASPLGVDIGGGIHAPTASSHTARSTSVTKHSTLNLWQYDEDSVVQRVTRTLAVPASAWGQDLQTDANWQSGNSHAPPSPLTSDTFKVRSHISFITPANASPGPWVFYCPTITNPVLPDSNEVWLIQQLNAAGIAVAGIDVGDTYGFPWGRELFSSFYDAMVARGFSTRPVMYCRSRGGLQVYNWAAENPTKLAAIGGIYPVGDMSSYPGLATAAPYYQCTTAYLSSILTQHNPIDRLAPIAAQGIPILHVHGDSDLTVPCSANSQVIHDRYVALGGSMNLVVIAGQGHNGSTLFFQNQALRDFMVQHAV